MVRRMSVNLQPAHGIADNSRTRALERINLYFVTVDKSPPCVLCYKRACYAAAFGGAGGTGTATGIAYTNILACSYDIR